MKISALTMQKDEADLLQAWALHHGTLFGYQNLHIFDNGSTDPNVIAMLGHLESLGVNVCRDFHTQEDFEQKGPILGQRISALDASDPSDFYFPLDCDEFIGVDLGGGNISLELSDIEQELKKYIGSPHILRISTGYDNHPYLADTFIRKENKRKCFFAEDACGEVDLGFHRSKSKKSDQIVVTNIVQFHFHFKPFGILRAHAEQKLSGRVDNFDRETLLSYKEARGRGYHLVDYILCQDEAEFRALFSGRYKPSTFVTIPAFAERFAALGSTVPFFDACAGSVHPRGVETAGSVNVVRPLGFDAKAPLRVVFGAERNLAGHVCVTPDSRFGSETPVGWCGAPDVTCAARRELREDIRTMIHGSSPATLRVAVPPGTYKITIVTGDAKLKGFLTEFAIGGASHSVPASPSRPRIIYTLTLFTKTETPFIDLCIRSSIGKWMINALTIEPADGVAPATLAQDYLTKDTWCLPAETDGGARALLRRWREGCPDLIPACPTGLTRGDYLTLISAGVDFFVKHQDATGAIIDPYRGAEIQYSTPCFAYAAGLIAVTCWRDDLLEPAIRALLWAAEGLALRNVPDGHEDFYPSPIGHAYRLLLPHLDQDQRRRLKDALSSMDPYAIYRKPVGGTGGSGSNWNCKAAAGEYILYTLGFRQDCGYASNSLLGQGQMFQNEYGLYAEGPAVYDAFPRAWLADMLAWGYDGPGRDVLAEALDRGALSSLFMQSPTGALSCGGRSAHHQWPDAVQCVIFELAAARAWQAGEGELAGVFKRAARRALAAVTEWQRPSGELWIVKNRISPALRHGYEVYSSHSQYNLLALTALGYAYEHAGATAAVPERLTPAETGTAMLDVSAGIERMYATADGTQVVLSRAAVHGQTALGLIRVHFDGAPAALAITDGTVASPLYQLPDGPRTDLAVGLAWPSPDGRITALNGSPIEALAGLPSTAAEVHVQDGERSGGVVTFAVEYRLTGNRPARVTETYRISRNTVEVAYSWSGWSGPVFLRFPVFLTDGIMDGSIRSDARGVTVACRGEAVRFEVDGGGAIGLGSAPVPVRTGYIRIAEAPLTGTTARLTVSRGVV